MIREENHFDYNDLAEYLKVSPGTLRHWVMAKKIPFVKVGCHVRFNRAAIAEWLAGNSFTPRSKGKPAADTGVLFDGEGGNK